MEPRRNENTFHLTNRSDTVICFTKDDYSIDIESCVDVFIYIIVPTANIEIRNCRNCKVFIAKVETCRIKNCSDMLISIWAENIELSHCSKIDLFCFVSHSLVLNKNSTQIQIGPYNAIVSKPIPNGENFWNKPVSETASEFSFIKPADFWPLVIPFGENDENYEIPVELPVEYKAAIINRKRIAEQRRCLILEFCQKMPNVSNLIQERIASAFQRQTREQLKELYKLNATEYI